MWDESELQRSGRANAEDVLAEIEAIEAEPKAAEIVPPAAAPIAGAHGGALRFQSAIEDWFKRKAVRDADPNTFEARLAQQMQDRNRRGWRAEYQASVGRAVRDYERDQTPERRKEKKAAKSKAERARRLARSTPEQIEAEKQAARDRAKASRVKGAGCADAEAEAEREAVRNLPTFGMM